MAKFANATVLDGGLAYLRANAVRILLLKAYAAGDSYATVAGNSICSITISTSDFAAISGASAAARVLGFLGKTGTASAGSGATPDLHLAFTDGSANVFWVTDETTDQVVTNGNSISIPAFNCTSNQPT